MDPERFQHLFETGRAAWPDVAIDYSVFTEYLEQQLCSGEQDLESLGDRGADLYLACACSNAVPKALETFDQRYISLVPEFLANIDSSKDFVQEVQQQLREGLFVPGLKRGAKIAEYQGRGKLLSWLRVVAIRTAIGLLRGRRKGLVNADDEFVQQLPANQDPELECLRAKYAEQFREAFIESLVALEPRDRTVLRLHLYDRLTEDVIGQLFEVHRTTVARWIARTRETLFVQTRKRLRERLGLRPSEFESLVRLVRSQLDVSIYRILREQDE